LSLNGLERGLESLVKLLEITGVGQYRLSQGFKEDPFRVRGPTCAANDIKELGVVLIARKTGNCLFHFAESPLEALNLIRGGIRF
jgi:hypothetical protein